MSKAKRPSWARSDLGRLIHNAGLDVSTVAKAMGQSYASTWRMISGVYDPSSKAILALWEVMHSHGVDGGALLNALKRDDR